MLLNFEQRRDRRRKVCFRSDGGIRGGYSHRVPSAQRRPISRKRWDRGPHIPPPARSLRRPPSPPTNPNRSKYRSPSHAFPLCSLTHSSPICDVPSEANTHLMSPSALISSIRRSSPSIARIREIRRLSASAPATAAAAYGRKGPEGRDIAVFLKVAGGVVASGSALGLWLLSSDPNSSDPEVDPAEKRGRYLFGDAYRKKVFFNYEKRLRLRSPPEKIFEYFASYRSPEGELFMKPADLMRAVVPVFPPSDSGLVREGSLRGERHPGELYCAPSRLFMLFDTNNDGLISFSEYIFFVTLLSIPESSFSVAFKMFDHDNNGEIDRAEFKKVMALMRSVNRQGACHSNGKRSWLSTGKSVEKGGLVEYFFGKDGTGYLRHDKFVDFLRELHDEIVQLEFTHYDHKLSGTISAKDFGLSMVASVESNQVNKFLDRVDDIGNNSHLKNIRITLEEFKAFAELRNKLKPFTLAIFGYGKVNGLLTKQDFRRAASHVCGIYLSDNVIDVVYHIFDDNRDGNLSYKEFLSALQNREEGIRQPALMGLTGFASCWFKCMKSFFSAEAT